MPASTRGSRANLALVAPDALRQRGLFTDLQGRSAGLSRGVQDHLLRTGEIVSVDHNVYRSALTPPSWEQRLLAACLAGPAVASHRSAGALWHVPDLERISLEVTALRHRRRKASDVVWHESLFLDPRDVTELEGIPVTSATRTVLDLAGVLDDDALVRVVDDVLRRNLSSIERLGMELERMGPRRPGARRMRAALERRLDGHVTPVTDLETVFDNLLRRHGLPPARRQHWVCTPSGKRYCIDFAYLEYRIGMEPMGRVAHADQWDDDMERLADLADMDWQILPFSNQRIRHGEESVVRAIRHALLRAGHRFD
jgi:very-short-patch-repair endonuclease